MASRAAGQTSFVMLFSDVSPKEKDSLSKLLFQKVLPGCPSTHPFQDFFDSRLLAMDTDFRIFSAQHHGSLPGIDLAYIMDGAAYHTKQDTVARIRKGTVQVGTSLALQSLGLLRGCQVELSSIIHECAALDTDLWI